jgi:putative phosphoesterase
MRQSPMKVALIGDVHANLPALEAVLEDARKRRSEAVWNVGDFVGYGPFPDAVVQRLNGRGISSIIGNYDQKVLEFPANKESWRQTKMPEKYLAFGWAYAHLSAESRRFLRTLPQQLLLSVQGVRVLLTHGSPASDEEHLGPDTPPDRLARLAESVDVDVVLCGHSHQPFDRQVNGVRFINPGSVGRPEGEDRRAAYALLTFTRGTLHLLQRRVRYDVTRTVEALRLAGLPKDFAGVFLQGKPLAELSAGSSRPARTPPPVRAREQDRPRLKAVMALAKRCRYEAGHTHQVTRLALELFDALQELHRLGPEDRFVLQCGAMLHDIGWIEGIRGHHKTAFRLIMEAEDLPFAGLERRLVGLIARYHRKALPSSTHPEYAVLPASHRRRLRILAGILRVADGLDRSHGGLVRRLRCHVSPKKIVIECDTMGPALSESVAALAKAVLLERVFRRKVRIRMHGQSGFSAGPTCSKTLRTSGIRLPAPRREAGAG